MGLLTTKQRRTTSCHIFQMNAMKSASDERNKKKKREPPFVLWGHFPCVTYMELLLFYRNLSGKRNGPTKGGALKKNASDESAELLLSYKGLVSYYYRNPYKN